MTYFTQDMLEQVRAFIQTLNYEPLNDDELETLKYRTEVGAGVVYGDNQNDLQKAFDDLLIEMRVPSDAADQILDFKQNLMLAAQRQ